MQAATNSFVEFDSDNTGKVPFSTVVAVLEDIGLTEELAELFCQSAAAMTPKGENVRYKKLLEWIFEGTNERANAQLTGAPKFEHGGNPKLSVTGQHQVNESNIPSRGGSSSREAQPQQSVTPGSQNGTGENIASQSPKESGAKQPGHSRDAKVVELEKQVSELQATVAEMQDKLAVLWGSGRPGPPSGSSQSGSSQSAAVDLTPLEKLTLLWEGWQTGALTAGGYRVASKASAGGGHSMDTSWQIQEVLPKTYEEALEQVGGKSGLEQHKKQSNELKHKYAPSVDVAKLLPSNWSLLGRSVKINFQDYADTLEELILRMAQQETTFREKIQALATATNGTPVIPPMKGTDRAKAKGQFKYKDLLGRIAWYRLTDLLRATLLYEDIKSMYEALLELEKDTSFQIIEFNDRYLKPLGGGYRDLQLTVKFQSVVFELQMNTRLIATIKEKSGHREFEVARELEASLSADDVTRCENILKWGLNNLGQNAQTDLQVLLNAPEKRYLHKAARRGNAEAVRCLLDFRADADIQDPDGRTPLHDAMAGGNERAAWALLNHGNADPHITDKEGHVALVEGLVMLRTRPDDEPAARTVSLLAQSSKPEIFTSVSAKLQEILEKRYRPSSEMVVAAYDGDVGKVKNLLCSLANPNSQNSGKEYALQVAVSERHVKVVELLLDCKANPDVTCASGQSLLWLAVENRYFDEASALIRGGSTKLNYCHIIPTLIGSASVDYGDYSGIAMGPDWLFYCAPHNASNVLVIDPVAQKTFFIEVVGDGGGKYSGIAAGPDGMVYCAPSNASNVLVIDPVAQKTSFIEGVGDGESKYSGIAAGPDGMLYCAPHYASNVLVIDPVAQKTSVIEGDLGYSGIVAGPDGMLYCAPFVAPNVLVIDPVAQKTSFIECPGDGGYRGIAAGPDGMLYCTPGDASNVLVIDPVAKRISFIEGAGDGESGYSGIAAGPDGMLYCAPNQASNVLVIDPVEKTFLKTAVESVCCGIAARPDGLFCCCPASGESVLKFASAGLARLWQRAIALQAVNLISGFMHKRWIMPLNTQSYCFIEGAGDGESKYSGIAAGPDGMLYCAPNDASNVLVIDPVALKTSFIEGVGDGESKYSGIAAGSDGMLYCAPSDASNVLVIDPVAQKTSFIEGVGYSEAKYSGIAAGSDGMLYCAPNDASNVLVIDPVAQKTSFIEGAGDGESKYSGIAAGPDGMLYCAPNDASNVLVIDPVAQKTSFIEGVGDGECKYRDIAAGSDGMLYCAPSDASNVLVIDPLARKTSFIEGVGDGECKYSGIAAGPDGMLYCTPDDASNVLVIDPVAQKTFVIEGVGDEEDKYRGMAAGPDGMLYCAPQTSIHVLALRLWGSVRPQSGLPDEIQRELHEQQADLRKLFSYSVPLDLD